MRLLTAVLAASALAFGWGVLAQQRDGFPHERHAGLFPLCEGCHQGVPEGDRARFYPEPAQCARCHDGAELRRVDWTGPVEEPDNVAFEHPEHPMGAERTGGIDCTTCHTPAGAPRMAVTEQPVVARCLACHEHRAASHYVDADCGTCHIPLARAPFERARILALPLPVDHVDARFIRVAHGDLAGRDLTRCAVCHTRERCESCHVDAPRVATIAQMPAATGMVARELPPFPAHYPIPPSHERPDFIVEHGARASFASCGTCHSREDCAACHASTPPAAVLALNSRVDVAAAGVLLGRRMPPSHQAPLFSIEHGNAAATGGASCMACHTRTMCVDCHQAAATGAEAGGQPLSTGDVRRPVAAGFHPPNYLARHSAEAYGRRLECSNCHDARLFCADCHATAGMSPAATPGRLEPGFHDAEPLWLLRHGQAARQGLESCASCHRQNECMQCHSVLGSFSINPHGPDFEARRAQRRNAAVCLVCHVTDPLDGTSP